MVKSRKNWLFVLLLMSITFVFVANTVVVKIVSRKRPSVQAICTGKIPELKIELEDVSLEELNIGEKDTKYAGNTAQIVTCDKTFSFDDVEIKGRGNSTWGQPKNPYQIKFSKKEDLFGMGKARKWVLLANYFDDSYLRTDVAFYFEDLLGENYALKGEFIKLSINGEYLGLYYLTSKVEIDKNRVDLKDPLGILVELDNLHEDEDHFTVGENLLQLKDLVAEDNEEVAVEDFSNDLEYLTRATKKKDLSRVSKVVDIESMVRYYLLSEFTANPDAYSSSFYMYKDGPDDKIHFGPGWDFDYGLGNKRWIWALKDDFYSPFEMSIIGHYDPEDSEQMIWLVNSSEFHELVAEMYREKLMGRKGEILSFLDMRAEHIWEEAMEDSDKWERDFVGEYEYLREWLSNRFDFFDEYYGGMSELDKHML